MILAAILIVAAYLLGSVPFALVIGKFILGVDVRKSGSGNIGTTNVFRVLGWKAGVAVFAGDFLKGFLPVYTAAHVFELDNAALVTVLVAGAAVAGHTWSIFLRGRGGKGVATGGGAVLAMMPWLFLLVFGIFWLVLLIDRRVSVASLSAATGLCVAAITTSQPAAYIAFAIVGTAVVFYAHRSNLQRLSRGEERRVDFPWTHGAGSSKARGESRDEDQQKTGTWTSEEAAAVDLAAAEDLFMPLDESAAREASGAKVAGEEFAGGEMLSEEELSFDFLKDKPSTPPTPEPEAEDETGQAEPLKKITKKLRIGKQDEEPSPEPGDEPATADETEEFEWEDRPR